MYTRGGRATDLRCPGPTAIKRYGADCRNYQHYPEAGELWWHPV